MNKITFNLDTSVNDDFNQNKQIDCYLYDTLSSTNDQVWLLEKDDSMNFPFVVMARQQTAGKGQRGNVWESQLGGLYLSLGLELNLPVNYIHHLTLFSVGAIASAFEEINIPVKIKWLNDLILKEKKLGGILWETKIEKGIIKKAVMGVGINYQNSNCFEGISLNSYLDISQKKETNSLEKIGNLVTNAIIKGYNNYLKYGIDKVLKNYNNLLYNHQQLVLIEKNKGIILGVNEKGELLVKIASLNAQSIVKFSPDKYSISYDKDEEGYYLIKEKYGSSRVSMPNLLSKKGTPDL